MDQLKEYRHLLRLPGARSLLFLSLLTRGINIPLGALITVIAYEISGSWTDAAVTGGIAALASALSMWLSGKAMDIWNPRLILILFLPGSLVPLLFLLEPEGIFLFLLALFLGLTRPPSGTTLRTSWQRLVQDEKKRLLAYGLDASLVPLAGALGAFLGGVLLALLGNEALIIFLTFMAFVSTLLLAFHKTTKGEGARKDFSFRELIPGSQAKENLPKLDISIIITILIVALSWGALVGLEILVGDRFGSETLLFVTAFGAVAVALGALLSHRARDHSGKRPLALSSFLAAGSLLLITLAFAIEPLLAFPSIISFGVARGIISATGSTYLSIASPEERRSEALALYGSGVLVGQAVYRPLAGVLLLFAPALILLLPAALFTLLAFDLERKKTLDPF